MTVRELLKVIISDLWITFGEDPSDEYPDITCRIRSDVDADEAALLSEWVLESEVYLMTAKDDAIFISLNGGKQ